MAPLASQGQIPVQVGESCLARVLTRLSFHRPVSLLRSVSSTGWASISGAPCLCPTLQWHPLYLLTFLPRPQPSRLRAGTWVVPQVSHSITGRLGVLEIAIFVAHFCPERGAYCCSEFSSDNIRQPSGWEVVTEGLGPAERAVSLDTRSICPSSPGGDTSAVKARGLVIVSLQPQKRGET